MARLFNTTIASKDPHRLAEFWGAALGYRIVEGSEVLARLTPPSHTGGPDLLILESTGSAPADSAIHFDLSAADVLPEVERLIGLGATLVDSTTTAGPAWREANGLRWIVLRDPDGNQFCVGDEPTDTIAHELSVRVAVPDDVSEIAHFHCAAALTGYAHIFPSDAAKPTPASLEVGWRSLLNDPHVLVFTAVYRRRLVGSVVLAPGEGVPSRLLVKGLYVDPSLWGLGIGSVLHDRALGEARNRGAEDINLWVLEDNVRAREMYERRGWELVAGYQLANDPPEIIDVLYEKHLGQVL